VTSQQTILQGEDIGTREIVCYPGRTFRLGIREHRCRVRETRLDTPTRTNGTSGSADVAADSDVPSKRESTNSILTVKDNDEICDICADLKAPANATRGDTRWRGP
jgi:hypothetical protein